MRLLIRTPFLYLLPSSVSRRSYFRLVASDQVLQLVQELVDILELAVDGGEANVSDFIELAQAFHDARADLSGRHFALFRVVEPRLDLVDDRIEPRGRDGPLLARLGEARSQLLSIEAL